MPRHHRHRFFEYCYNLNQFFKLRRCYCGKPVKNLAVKLPELINPGRRAIPCEEYRHRHHDETA